MQSIRVDGRLAVVTGAGSGIGLAIGTALAEAGASVVLTDIRAEEGARAAEDLRRRGLDVTARVADASREADWTALFRDLEREGRSVDILVHNAGMQHVAPFEEFPTDVFQRMLQIMLVGPFIGTKLALPAMKRKRFGRIINVASINGLIGFPGKAAYNAAKHGLIGLTRVAALETAQDGITVNALCPGYVDTPLVRNQLAELARLRHVSFDRVLEEVIYPLVPQRRLLDPEEVADYAVFLASDRARGVTGQAVVLDGGYTAQ